MKEVAYKLEIKPEGTTETFHCNGGTEYDEKKWAEILAICNERKASVFDLISDYLNKLTPEKAEEILCSWDF